MVGGVGRVEPLVRRIWAKRQAAGEGGVRLNREICYPAFVVRHIRNRIRSYDVIPEILELLKIDGPVRTVDVKDEMVKVAGPIQLPRF